MKVELKWATPDGDAMVAHMARVSNPTAQPGDPADRLIRYLIRHKHWSPFEMVNACIYIECPRDISRQILRHRSFSFQEFSGRYAAYDDLLEHREVRLQDDRNRQHSLPCPDGSESRTTWESHVRNVRDTCRRAYRDALALGIAKEVARVLLPEGLVPTRMYMNGTLRSWLHYIDIRTGPETQKEHREIAEAIREIIYHHFPAVAEAHHNTSEKSIQP